MLISERLRDKITQLLREYHWTNRDIEAAIIAVENLPDDTTSGTDPFKYDEVNQQLKQQSNARRKKIEHLYERFNLRRKL